MLELLEKLNTTTRKQARYVKLQCLFMLITAGCFVGIFLLVRDFLPQIQSLLAQLPGMMEQMELVLSNMEQVTSELAAVDFSATVDGINNMVATGQTSLQETVAKLNTIDFDALNLAIENLSDVVTPLANFFGKFK